MLARNAVVDSEVRVSAEAGETPGGAESGAEEGDSESCRWKNSKIRRLEDAPLSSEWTHELHSTDSGHTVACKFSVSAVHECGIMHEPTHLVEIADLPQAWPREDDVAGARSFAQLNLDAGANTAHLPCGHVFSPCALVFHFLVHDMRCPICRVGCKSRMSISCVPACVRAMYAKKMELVETLENEEIETMETMDVVSFLTQMNLQVLVRFQRQPARPMRSSVARSMHAESLISSRLLVNEEYIASHVHVINQLSRQNQTAAHEREQDAASAPRSPAAAAGGLAPPPPAPTDADGDPNTYSSVHRSSTRSCASCVAQGV